MSWSPNPEALQSLAGILSVNNRSSSEFISNSYNQLEEAKRNPEFLKYIVFIFANGQDINLDKNIRIIAGYTLKTCLKTLLNSETPEDKLYIRGCVVRSLIDQNQQIRNAAGVLITHIVTVCGLNSWPELIPSLYELLKSNNQDYMIAALSCLSKVMEDNIFQFDSADVNYPLNDLIPMLLSFFQYQNEEIVYHSVNCMRFTIVSTPLALLTNMDNYLAGLAWLLERTNPDTLALICNSIVSILSVRVDALIGCMKDIFKFMIHATSDANAYVAKQATEFWSVYGSLEVDEDVLNLLQPVLSELIPILNMRYSDEELERMHIDSNASCDNYGVRPFIYQGSTGDK